MGLVPGRISSPILSALAELRTDLDARRADLAASFVVLPWPLGSHAGPGVAPLRGQVRRFLVGEGDVQDVDDAPAQIM